MAQFNPFPVGYQPYNMYQYQPQQVQQPAAQTKYVEAIPVDTIEEADNCPMAAGTSAVFFAKDDSFVAVKTLNINGNKTFDVFDKRPPAPRAPLFNPEDYVRKDEIDGLIAAAVAATQPSKQTGKKSEAEK